MTVVADPAVRVVVVGANGRMGRAACEALANAEGVTLKGQVGRGDDLAAALTDADVLVDLSVPDASPTNVAAAVRARVHAVVGTTGWDEERLTALREQLSDHPDVGVLIAPNFSIGALLVADFAVRAARFFPSAEIIELHHPDKVDAPSGTAIRTARLIAEARQAAGIGPAPDATSSGLAGARGADVDGIPVHSVRLRGMVAHQEVLLGGAGEYVTLRHDSIDRTSFMPGVLMGVRDIADHPGLTVGLEHWLDL